MSKPFTIVHDKHGEALCDEHQFAEFAGLGWKKKADKPTKPKGASGDKDGDGKPDDPK